jgi:hypothetical protein
MNCIKKDGERMIPSTFATDARMMKDAALAEKYGICRRQAENWREKLGIVRRFGAIDHDKLRAMIKAGKSREEIQKALGCHKSTVNDMKRRMGLGRGPGRKAVSPTAKVYEAREEIIPPADRERMLLQRKMAGMSPEHRRAFLGGVAYQQTVREL